MINRESYVDKHDEEKIDFGLKKIYKLLNIMGNPQDELKVIHIAGTNGKGSVSNYLAYILACSGLKVGKISSPVIFSKMEFAQIYRLKSKAYDSKVSSLSRVNENDYLEQNRAECICIQDADENIFNNLVDVYKSDIELIKPSGYELQIALSLQYFKDELCEIVIVETGMGGGLDATNVFKNTLCDVLTSISLDHVGMIGNNLEEIALCKCGIITKGGNVVTTSSNYKIMRIIQDKCREYKSNLTIANIDRISNVQLELDNNTFEYIPDRCINKKNRHTFNEESTSSNEYNGKNINKIKYNILMNGRHQIENAIIAIEVIDILNFKGYNIPLDIVKMGLNKMRQKARFDVIKKDLYNHNKTTVNNTMLIVDGAHNTAGAKSLVCGINDYIDRENSRIIYVINMFKDKEYKDVIKEILNNADEIWTFETTNSRSLESYILYSEVKKQVSELVKLGQLDREVIVKNIETMDRIEYNYNNLEDSYYKNNIIVCAGSLSFMKDIYGRLI